MLIKNLLMLIILLRLKKLKQTIKLLNLKLMAELELQNKNIFNTGYVEIWSREIFITDSVLKTYTYTFKLNDLNGEKIIGSSYEKELFVSILEMSWHSELDSNIRDIKSK